ncbi:hypothetical protein A6A25_30630 [Saccharothrix sp. CB00851]|nr:hypothetical protein A6A25_30630 [Saccharothrix sp. CB00851]
MAAGGLPGVGTTILLTALLAFAGRAVAERQWKTMSVIVLLVEFTPVKGMIGRFERDPAGMWHSLVTARRACGTRWSPRCSTWAARG